ncbi:MAG TPA: type II secretion system F family protein [Verrucomicrobiae bacterium]|nr:type II secretion system F family protein [Verrucomicrobiae bacterium]
MVFSYKAVKKDGTAANGTVEAANHEAAIQALTHQGLHPLVVKAAAGKGKGGGNISFGNFGKRVKSSDLVIFTRQLATMVSAGVPLARGLELLQEDPESPYFRQVLADVTKTVEGGQPLGDAFAKYPNVFSDVYVNMVKAGEEGGILDQIMKRLAKQIESDASMKKQVKSAMAYPIVIGCITVVAFFGIMFILMPKLGSIFAQLAGPGYQLPIYTRTLLNFADYTRKYFFLYAPVVIVGIVLLRRYLKSPTGKYRWHGLLLRLPIVGPIVTKIAIARFARTFSSLMGAGVGVLEALSVTGGAIGNKIIEKELADAAEAVKAGKSLSAQLATSPHFPRIIPEMLQVGEETGQMDKVLVKVADFYDEEVRTTMEGLSSVIEPIMILVLGAGVGVIAASVMGPLAQLSTHINGNGN